MLTPACLLLSLLLASAPVADVEQAVQNVYDGGGYQTGHPRAPAPDLNELPQMPPALLVILKTLMWVGVAVLLTLGLVSTARRLQGRDRRDAPPPRDTMGKSPPPVLDAPLGDAETLAAAGRYEDAVHVLLLQTLQILGRHQQISAALTSREILERLQLDPAPMEALGRLVGVVEVSHFGGREADRATYETCVEAFEALRASFGEEAA